MKKEWIALSPSARRGGRGRRPWAVVDHVDAQQGHTARGRSRGRTRCEGRGYVAVTRINKYGPMPGSPLRGLGSVEVDPFVERSNVI